MKKILSILLAVCMLLTMFTLPAVAAVVDDGTGTYQYHKFDFSKDQYAYKEKRENFDSDIRSFSTLSFGKNSFGNHSGETPLKSDRVVVDYVEHNGKTALRIRANSDNLHYQGVINPIYKGEDGKWHSVRLSPGKSYQTSYNIVVVRAYGSGNTRSQLEPWTNSSTRVWPDYAANTVKCGSVAVKAPYAKSDRLSAGGTSSIAYYSHAGLYVPHHNLHFDNSNITAGSKNVPTSVATYKITSTTTEGVTTYSEPTANSVAYGKDGVKNNTYTNTMTMKTVDELVAYGVEWNAGNKAYLYDTAKAGTKWHYTDNMGINFTIPNTANIYFDVTGVDEATLPFADQIIDIGDKKYARAYNEYLITDIEYYETGKGALYVGDKLVVGDAGETYTIPAPEVADGFLGWYDAAGNKVDTYEFKAGAPGKVTAKYADTNNVDVFSIAGKDITFAENNTVVGQNVKSMPMSSNFQKNGDSLIVTPQFDKINLWPADNATFNKNTAMKALTYATAQTAQYISRPIGGSSGTAAPGTANQPEDGKVQMVLTSGNTSNVYTLRDAEGKAITAEPGAKYMVKVAYKQLGAGTISLAVGAGRPADKVGQTSLATAGGKHSSSTDAADDLYNSDYKTLGKVENVIDSEIKYADYEFVLPADFTGAPEFNLSVSSNGLLVKSDYVGDGNGNYELEDGSKIYYSQSVTGFGHKDWYRYQVLDVPEFEIQSIDIVKIESDEVALVHQFYDKGVGYKEVINVGKVGADATANAPANFEGKWYTNGANTNNVLSTYPAKDAVVYDYGVVVKKIGYGDNVRNYVGVRGIHTVFTKDGEETIHALQYKPHTYADAYEWTGKGLMGEAEMPNEATQLKNMKDIYGKGLWNMYRIGVAEAGTYKITLKYKATVSSPVEFRFAVGTDYSVVDSSTNIYLKTNYKVNESTDGFVTKDIFVTVDNAALVTEGEEGRDDNFAAYSKYLYLHFYHDVDNATFSDGATQPEILISDIELKEVDAVNVGGASALTEEAAAEVGKQAMRVYFSYKTNDGDHIIIDGVEYAIKERGFLYGNGAIASYTSNLTAGQTDKEGNPVAASYLYRGLYTSKVVSKINANFNNCWAYDEATSELTFSNYISSFGPELLDTKLLARAYVIFEDAEGNEFTVYSGLINRSINGIKAAGDVNIGVEDVPEIRK